MGGRVGQASHLLFCPLFPVSLPIETGSIEVTGQGPAGREPYDFYLLVIFCKCPIYRSLPLHMNLMKQNGFHFQILALTY